MTGADRCPGFDFQTGRWRVRHRRLKARLTGCAEWDEFDGTCEARPLLGGCGNIEDNLIQSARRQPTAPWRCARSIRPAATGRSGGSTDARPHSLDVPVIGRFENGIGTFFADDLHDRQPIKLRFFWLATDTDSPRWEQAMSTDGGQSWETNWVMDFERV